MSTIDDMLRQTDFELQKDRKDKLPAETQARQELESAKNRLHQVKTAKDAGGNLRHSWEDRREAQDDFKAKFKAHRKASNDGARQRRENAMAAEKKVRDDARATEQAKQADAYEAQTRQSYRVAWKGDDKSFNAAWPGMWEQHLVADAQEQMKLNKTALLNVGGYSKF